VEVGHPTVFYLEGKDLEGPAVTLGAPVGILLLLIEPLLGFGWARVAAALVDAPPRVVVDQFGSVFFSDILVRLQGRHSYTVRGILFK
jgi:hypothetical protein